jgi:SOS-response transcriptional repressor LexA
VTPQQKQLLDYLRTFGADDVQPSISEMSAHLGLTGRSSVHRMLQLLKAEGLVEKLAGGERCWRAVPVDPFKGQSDQALADELRRRGYTVTASKMLQRHPDSGWAGNPVKAL